ncbi:uncharacterized protein TRIADDRAFT_64220 [Trichoplax adhaerens]|uniref:HECT-type E3 ubiquitin transferase n=1 Tax=Trichoplax adhaerens TaxID=10228 RepID=B3S6M1_TRIAD|nr:hypothetical protein TRIADDRAFT_64220 [Trichoplax adhaerens]EDV21645.1 hypothetical protein TRIADDRAFT_64220 [Trichoplax adhaerens]|eukprot:XP_002115793.1 hypothetical protein TRIADDRAFT_64220 [Trichoplax adhaerens]
MSYFVAGLQSLFERIPQFIQTISAQVSIPRTDVVFQWNEPCRVGREVTFSVLSHRNQYGELIDSDQILIEIHVGGIAVPFTVEIFENPRNLVHLVRFVAHRSGSYTVSIMRSGQHIRGSPFIKIFDAGPVDPLKTAFANYTSTVVVTNNIYHSLDVIAKDKYGNVCSPKQLDKSLFNLRVNKLDAKKTSHNAELVVVSGDTADGNSTMLLKISEPGCFRAIATYNNIKLKNGEIIIISLTESEASEVDRIIKSNDTNLSYQIKYFSSNVFDKARSAYSYISPRQLTIKEFYLKFIPRTICNFRIRPHTKFSYSSSHSCDPHILTISDGLQPPVTIWCEKRNILVAIFNRYLQRSLGGSESFQHKRSFFYQEVRKVHASHPSRAFTKLRITNLNRKKILKSFMSKTARFDVSDWCHNFEVSFELEEALDWGGVRRELFEILNTELFTPSENGLFTTFDIENKQALIHPNTKRADSYPLSFYELCGKIVGKCLYDSAQGEAYHLLVKARFSRSFLAQMLGLRVSYDYFSSDDPELYKTKIKYILDNDVTELNLTFAEEEYSSSGNVVKVVDLKSNGRFITVTEENKIEYLNLLSQHRLAKKFTSEMDHFLKGVHLLIPENLLAIFDESELELLMCGIGNISISDMKLNCIATDSSRSFGKILRWFWAIVGTFSQEELARLLQFVTGSSQLPPGGFKELRPSLQISPALVQNGLPTSHTCFNQLCLPEYDSSAELKRCLILAINEGSEGFGLV